MNTEFDSLTLHGIVDLHTARAKNDGPHTIEDHLILDGIADLPILKKYYGQIYAALKEDGQHHDLLGSVYVLAQRRGGRQPEGFGEDPPRGFNKVKLDPNKAMIVSEFRDVAERDHAFAGSAPAILGSARAVATISSRRKQEQIIAGPLALDQENAFLRQKNEFLERELELYRSGRVSAPAAGPAGLLAARGQRTGTNTPASSNGGNH